MRQVPNGTKDLENPSNALVLQSPAGTRDRWDNLGNKASPHLPA